MRRCTANGCKIGRLHDTDWVTREGAKCFECFRVAAAVSESFGRCSLLVQRAARAPGLARPTTVRPALRPLALPPSCTSRARRPKPATQASRRPSSFPTRSSSSARASTTVAATPVRQAMRPPASMWSSPSSRTGTSGLWAPLTRRAAAPTTPSRGPWSLHQQVLVLCQRYCERARPRRRSTSRSNDHRRLPGFSFGTSVRSARPTAPEAVDVRGDSWPAVAIQDISRGSIRVLGRAKTSLMTPMSVIATNLARPLARPASSRRSRSPRRGARATYARGRDAAPEEAETAKDPPPGTVPGPSSCSFRSQSSARDGPTASTCGWS